MATKNLNKAVTRNQDRFPVDFMFQLTADEASALRFQSGTLKRGQHFKYLPYALHRDLAHKLAELERRIEGHDDWAWRVSCGVWRVEGTWRVRGV